MIRRALSVLAAIAVAPSAHAAGSAVAVFPNGAAFTLEVADDAESRRVGYMYRDSVGAAEGMLFVFEEDGLHSMWMKNCKVGLDMVWLDPAYRVVEFVERTKPCPEAGECPSIIPTKPSRFVLELASGTVARQSLKVGDAIAVLTQPSPRP
jgi:uncharacterized membrane protein (UPF0127 family)